MLIKIIWGCFAALFLYFGSFLVYPNVEKLKKENPAKTAFMEYREKEWQREGKNLKIKRRWVPLSRISPFLIKAVIIAEDDKFYQHEGFDFEAIQKAMEKDLKAGKFKAGGSTISQQLVKNLYLSPSKNPVRKLREVMITRRLEAELPKRRILELYLNVIEWGDGIFGVEAAARAYFSTSAAGLGAEPSALLAGAIINPRLLNPGHPTPRLRRRQRLILGRMGHVVPPPEAVPSAAPAPNEALPVPEPAPRAVEPAPSADPPPPEGGSGGSSSGRTG